MRMVGHYHLSEDHDPAGLASFIQRVGHHSLDLVFSEDREPIVGDGCQKIGWIIAGDPEHRLRMTAAEPQDRSGDYRKSTAFPQTTL